MSGLFIHLICHVSYTQIDTLSFKIPLSTVNIYDNYKFKPYTFKTSGREVKQLTTADLKTPGLNLIRIDELGGEGGEGEVIIELSAKLLGRHYPEYITANTFEDVLNRINTAAPIELKIPETFDTAAPLKLHTGRNVKLTEAPARYLKLLQLLHVNSQYVPTLHRNGNTLSYSKNVATRKAKEFVKFYDKGREFELSNNKSFRESLNAADRHHIRQQFQNTMRFEDEQNSVTKIKQRFNLPQYSPVRVADLLTSQTNTIANVFNKLTANMAQHSEQINSRFFFDSLTADEQAVLGPCMAFGYDLHSIKANCFHNVSRPTRSKKLKISAQLVSKFQAQQGQLQDSDFRLLDELRQQLTVSI